MFKSAIAATMLMIVGQASASGLFELSNPTKKKSAIQTSTSGSMLSVRVAGTNHGGTISITGPNGFHISEHFDGSSATVNLLEKYSKLPAGTYQYQISAHVGELKLIQDTIDNGRGENNYTYAGTPVDYSGSFRVNGGSIKQFSQSREGSASEW